jgi:hypothetical protein
MNLLYHIPAITPETATNINMFYEIQKNNRLYLYSFLILSAISANIS